MLSIQTILAPVDFSERSDGTAAHAAALALHFDAKVLYVHVTEDVPADYGSFAFAGGAKAAERQEEFLRESLQRLIDRHAAGADAEAVLLSGDPARRIEALARERNADLIVIPTHGYGAFRQFLVGSVTAKVLHDVDCPVFTGVHLANAEPFPAPRYERVACAISLREKDEGAKLLAWARDFARSWSAKLIVIHTPPALEWGAAEWLPDDTKELIEQAARDRLTAMIEQAGCEAEVCVGGADANSFVTGTMRAAGADVLIIGRSSAHGLFSGVHANTFGLIRDSPAPVISV